MRKLYWFAIGAIALIGVIAILTYTALNRQKGSGPLSTVDLGSGTDIQLTSVSLGSSRTTPQSAPVHDQPSVERPAPTAAQAVAEAVATQVSTPGQQPRQTAIDLTAFASASASSMLAPEKTERFGVVQFDASNVLDRDPATSWVEGVNGPGIGEQVVLTFSKPINVLRLGLNVGFDRDEKIFYANNRIRRVRLIFSDGSARRVDFLDQRGIQYIAIEHGPTTSIAITIEEVYPGSAYDDTAIAEVKIWGYESP